MCPTLPGLPCLPAVPPKQDVQYNQVLQAVLLAQFEMQAAPGQFRADADLPDDIVDRALAAWQLQQQAAKLSSFQLEVSEALSALGVEHELEYLTAVNLLSVDIAIVAGGAWGGMGWGGARVGWLGAGAAGSGGRAQLPPCSRLRPPAPACPQNTAGKKVAVEVDG